MVVSCFPSLTHSQLWSTSADKTGALWDVESGHRIKKLKHHTSYVNWCLACFASHSESVAPLRRYYPLAVTGSDDGTAKVGCSFRLINPEQVWDTRFRGTAMSLPGKFPVLATEYSDAGDRIFSAGLDNVIKVESSERSGQCVQVWDTKMQDVVLTLDAHTDSVTSLSLSPDGTYLLSNSMDHTIRVWDVRPFCAGDRCVKTLMGAQHNFEKNLIRASWSPDGQRVGSSLLPQRA
jgi:Prp8 binding protein